jgi:hypothetical protein
MIRLTELEERAAVVQPTSNEWLTKILADIEEVGEQADSAWKEHRFWPRIHSLEERVNARDTDLTHLAEQVPHHLANEPNAARRKAAQAELDRLCKHAQDAPDDPRKKGQALERARTLIRDSHGRSRVTFDSGRKTRIGLLWGAGVLLAFAVVAVFAQSKSRDAFVPLPESAQVGSTLFLTLLLGAGALGGMLSAVFSLYLTKDVEDTSWFDPRPALAWTKVSIGAWASVIAAVAVGTGALVGNFTSVPAALLIGVAFGYAQQAVTGILDKHTAGLTGDTSRTT